MVCRACRLLVVLLATRQACVGSLTESHSSIKDLLDISDLVSESTPTCQRFQGEAKLSESDFVDLLGCSAEEPTLEESFSFWWGGVQFEPTVFAEFCNRVSRNQINAGRVAPLYAFAVIVTNGSVHMTCCSKDQACDTLLREGIEQHEDLKSAVSLLQDLLSLVDFDMQFLLAWGDEPFASQVLYSNVPIFHPSGSSAYWSIPWPSVYHTRALLRGELDRNATEVAWESKTSKAWWRGTLTAPSTTLISTAKFHPRLRLMNLSAQDPDLLDAAFTAIHPTLAQFQWGKKEVNKALAASKARLLPYEDFWSHAPKFKYILIVPGVTQSPQLSNVLRTGSVPLVVWDITFEHLYPLLTPWIHFVPIRSDLSDLLPTLKLLRNNDTQARAIAENAKQIAADRVQPTATYCYLWRGLRALRSLTSAQRPVLQRALDSGSFTEIPRIDIHSSYPDYTPIRSRVLNEHARDCITDL